MSNYLKIMLQNTEPVRIVDDSTSQSGQTVTLRYIPGTAIRGAVINALAQEEDFEEIKKSLFSDKIRYLNAYLTDGEQELIPSPKGFYEDKTEQKGKKKIDNVVLCGEFSEGKKRAALGRFCYMDEDCVHYCNVDTGSDLRIKINDEKQNLFRHEYICVGYTFTAYIAVEDESLKDRIKDVFSGNLVLGNARSAGLGKCRVIRCEYTDRLPYEQYLPMEDQKNECYMILLSGTVMRDEKGELCGLNLKTLEEKMGVSDLRISYCATSTVDVRGYNRKWGTRTPSTVMYEQGSVFHLMYNGTFTIEKMRALCDRGIGIRLNEGFGRVLFPDRYEDIKYKEMMQVVRLLSQQTDEENREPRSVRPDKEDEETLKVAAGCYYRNLLEKQMTAYVVEHPLSKGMVTNSQTGALEAFATAYQYQPWQGKKAIEDHLAHALDKEENNSVQKVRNSINELNRFVQKIFGTDLETLLAVSTRQKDRVMGIPKKELLTADEELRYKLELITRMIRYDNKKKGV